MPCLVSEYYGSIADFNTMTASLSLVVFISSVLVLVNAKCPSFFVEYNSACYYVANNRVNNVNDAFRTCYSLGGYLMNIDADAENSYIVNKIKQQPTIFDGYWIGGFFNGQNWVWQKTDKTGNIVDIFMNPGEGQYKNWGPRQPNAIGVVYQPFVAIMVRYRPVPYRWYSESRALNMPGGMGYICEADWQPEA